MALHMSEADYYFPAENAEDYFNQRSIPSYKEYCDNFSIDFHRYLYYLIGRNASGSYPDKTEIKKVTGLTSNSRVKVKPLPKGVIKKLLIGEAPPKQKVNEPFVRYFYNTDEPLPAVSPCINSVKRVLFNNACFSSKTDFLVACAREGFLLIDLFPYAIKYAKRQSKAYKESVIYGFKGPYPFNIMVVLDTLSQFISKKISIAAGLMSFGNIIMTDPDCIRIFSVWKKQNAITLNPPGIFEMRRNRTEKGISDYIRVCGKQGSYGTVSVNLTDADF